MRLAAAVIAVLAAGALAAGAADAHPGPVGQKQSQLDRLVRAGAPVYCGGRGKRVFALTFDDGPGPWTKGLVAALRRGRAPATFFLVGNRVPLWRTAAIAEASYGAVGDHTWSHPRLTALPAKRVRRELLWTQQELRRQLEAETRLFRPPYERANAKVERVVRSLGLVDVRWNVDPRDSMPGAKPKAVARAAAAALRPGAIVLLHDTHPWTAAVVRRVLAAARRKHLRPVTVPQLLEQDPPVPGQSCWAPVSSW